MPETIVDIFGPVPYKVHLRRKGGLSRDGHIYIAVSVTAVNICRKDMACVHKSPDVMARVFGIQ